MLGYGIVANKNIHEVCRVVGISDIHVKLYGSTNPLNVVKGFFEILRNQKTPNDIALLRGKKVMDVEQSYYGYSEHQNK